VYSQTDETHRNTPLTRELAQRLLAYEAVTVGTANPGKQALYRVCDKLSRPLITMAGAAAFPSLLARALALAKKESPLLEDWEVRTDGSLRGLNGEAVESSIGGAYNSTRRIVADSPA
jgi:hypothetical protein